MKKNIGILSMNNTYDFIGITDMGENNYSTCNNCGRPIRYVCELKDSEQKKYYVGTECAKTLSEAKINNTFSMNEQIKSFKKVAEARNLIEKAENCKFWGNASEDSILIIGKSGKKAKKIFIEETYDPFTGKNYQFITSFLKEIYSTKEVKTGRFAPIDYIRYYNELNKKDK